MLQCLCLLCLLQLPMTHVCLLNMVQGIHLCSLSLTVFIQASDHPPTYQYAPTSPLAPCPLLIGWQAQALACCASFEVWIVLFTQTNKELVNIMACDIGHNVAYHEGERKSWRLLLNTVIIGSLAAGSSIGLLPLAVAAIGIDAVVNKCMVYGGQGFGCKGKV